jgi:predicted extracellular nuclease
MKASILGCIAIGTAAALAQPASAAVVWTEWMYSSIADGFEFFEITNTGAAPVDLTGWSYDDDSRTPGTVPLTSLGTLAAGESAIITEALTAEDFHAEWSAPASLKVLAGNIVNIGRADELNLFDASDALADRLTYGDAVITGSIRTQGQSGIQGSPAAVGANNVSLWVLSTVGDAYGSVSSLNGDIGNPGAFSVVPEPASGLLAVFGLAWIVRRRHRG